MVRKEEVKKFLDELGQDFYDYGNLMLDPQDDAVDFVNRACAKMMEDTENPRGIFFCGSGVMVDIAANRFPQVRSCLAFDKKQVESARNDDDVNALCIAANYFSLEETKVFIKAFLNTEFSGEERFVRRIGKLKT